MVHGMYPCIKMYIQKITVISRVTDKSNRKAVCQKNVTCPYCWFFFFTTVRILNIF